MQKIERDYIDKTASRSTESRIKLKQMEENKCIRCKEEIGNNVFTVCDDCWDKRPNQKYTPEPQLISLEQAFEFNQWCSEMSFKYNTERKLWYHFLDNEFKTDSQLFQLFLNKDKQ